jgi:glycine dehydrogenase subunit 1
MADYTPHTDAEVGEMLSFLGLASLDELFSAVPEALRLAGGTGLEEGLSEPDVMNHMTELAEANRPVGRDLVCFAGGGAYDHEVPPVTRSLASRSEFVTSYTPYQPEVAQGVLQALFEFQTLMARLSGLDVANASLYDGAAALVEAVNLGVAATGRQRVLVSRGLNPSWRAVLRTFAAGTGHHIVEASLVDGCTDWRFAHRDGSGEPPSTAPAVSGRQDGLEGSQSSDPGVVVVAYPNYLGCLEDLSQARELCDRTGALMVVAFDPVCAGVLRSPGEWGADVVVGEGQALGMPLGFGGPYLGLFACRSEYVRRLPGRLVGETVDTNGRRAYVTTLRAREQDIRREKATSNVCTNQTLMAVTAAIQMGWLGSSGIAEIALRSARGARYCRDALLSVPGVEPFASAPVLREFSVRLPVAAETLVERLADDGFLAGIPLDDSFTGGSGNALLIAVTERRTKVEIDAFADSFAKAVR